MASHCEFIMKVVGSKKENIEKFLLVMKAGNYEYAETVPEAARYIYTSELEIGDIREEEGAFSVILKGFCPWSVRNCMIEPDRDDYWEPFNEEGSEPPEISTLEYECKILDLTMDIRSLGAWGENCSEYIFIESGDDAYCEEHKSKEDWSEEYDSLDEFLDNNGIEFDI